MSRLAAEQVARQKGSTGAGGNPAKSRGTRRWRILIGLLPLSGFALALFTYVRSLTVMPGHSYRGAPPPLTYSESELSDRLRRDVSMLADTIGERNYRRYAALVAAMEYIETSFAQSGYEPRREIYEVGGQSFANLVVEVHGASDEVLVVGAHYDSAEGTSGANDNGTGVAALLALAEALGSTKPRVTLRFVAFVNEEPPHFHSASMGSLVNAKRCRERGENIVGMLALETMGYFSDEEGSQKYPAPLGWLYPTRGNFIGFVGNTESRVLVRDVVGAFRRHTQFPSEGAVLPSSTPGVGWSDHWAFWQMGYPGLMVTDTAPFRYPHYHTAQDTTDQVDFERLARVVLGLEAAIRELAVEG